MVRDNKKFRFPAFDDRLGVKLSTEQHNSDRPVANYDLFSEDEVTQISKEYTKSEKKPLNPKAALTKKKLNLKNENNASYDKPGHIPVPKFDRYHATTKPISSNKKRVKHSLFESNYEPPIKVDQQKLKQDTLKARLKKDADSYMFFTKEAIEEPQKIEPVIPDGPKLKVDEYRTFVNEPKPEDIVNPEDNFLPKARRQMQSAKAQQISSIPFKAKNNDQGSEVKD